MSIEGSLPELKNIPNKALVVVDKSTDLRTCEVRQFRNGNITLSSFACTQILEGLDIVMSDPSVAGITRESVQLVIKLSRQCMGAVNYIKVNLQDLAEMRRWLEFRMAHCEHERDERTTWNCSGKEIPKFNPDTYIGMKLLLLDLRELMLGEIV